MTVLSAVLQGMLRTNSSNAKGREKMALHREVKNREKRGFFLIKHWPRQYCVVCTVGFDNGIIRNQFSLCVGAGTVA